MQDGSCQNCPAYEAALTEEESQSLTKWKAKQHRQAVLNDSYNRNRENAWLDADNPFNKLLGFGTSVISDIGLGLVKTPFTAATAIARAEIPAENYETTPEDYPQPQRKKVKEPVDEIVDVDIKKFTDPFDKKLEVLEHKNFPDDMKKELMAGYSQDYLTELHKVITLFYKRTSYN